MPGIDIFNNEAFSLFSLTAAINKMPYQPKFLRDLNIFSSRPVRTTSIAVEQRHGKLSLLNRAGRGATQDVRSTEVENVRNFTIPHVPQHQTLLADDVQNVRAFGSESELRAVGQEVNRLLEGMRQNHEATHEFHRIGAVQGLVKDGDNSTVIYNYYTEFGVTEIEENFDFTDASASFKNTCNAVTRHVADELGMIPYTKILAICGDTYFDNVTEHASVKEGFERWQGSQFFRETQLGPEYNANMNGFDFGNITFVNYRGKIDDVPFFPAAQARFIPLGVPDLFIEAIAPGNFMESVNTPGQTFYARQRALPFNTGVEMHTQSNVLYIPTIPTALIKSTGTFS